MMPSQNRTMKSECYVSSQTVISGSAIKTPSMPPNHFSFASMSPKAQDTANQPGNIHFGPNTKVF